MVHKHSAGKPHFDLRLIENDILRSWSLLREPPRRLGERRLAIERESFAAEAAHSKRFQEEAFGQGRVYIWDEGEVEIAKVSPKNLVLTFMGDKLSGRYSFRQMRWYPGNRWLLQKSER